MSHWSHVCAPYPERRENERSWFKILELLLFKSLTSAWVLGCSVAGAWQAVTWFLLVICLQRIFKYFYLPYGGQQLPWLVLLEVCSTVTPTKLTGLWPAPEQTIALVPCALELYSLDILGWRARNLKLLWCRSWPYLITYFLIVFPHEFLILNAFYKNTFK